MANGVVFLHGMWSQRSVWEPWLPAFAERGYVCEAVTLPGHHGNARDEDLKGVGFAECLDAASRACARYARPVVIGHSLGGLIAQKLASQLDLRAVVILNSAAPRAVFPLRSTNVRGLSRHFVQWGLWRDVLRLTPPEADYLLFNKLADAERARAHDELLPESGRLAYQLGWGRLGSALHDVDRSAIRCPMLALAGVHDHMIPIDVSRAMARWYGDKLELREYEAAHWLIGEPDYRERIAEVQRWLADQGAEDGLTMLGARV